MNILSDVEDKIVILKKEGLTNKKIGLVVFPDAKPRSAEQMVSKYLQKPNVITALDLPKKQALIKHGVTYDWLIEKLLKKVDAEKIDFKSGEVLPDNGVQMSAIRTLLALLDDSKTSDENPNKLPSSGTIDPELLEALKNGSDDIEVQRILFKRKDD